MSASLVRFAFFGQYVQRDNWRAYNHSLVVGALKYAGSPKPFFRRKHRQVRLDDGKTIAPFGTTFF